MPDEAWLSVKESAKLLGWNTGRVYDLLGDLLVYRRPLPRKLIVSLKSVLKLKSESAAGFWRDLAKQNQLRDWVYKEMSKPLEPPLHNL
jgi:hypothetical protein